jgi:hypothetical protein
LKLVTRTIRTRFREQRNLSIFCSIEKEAKKLEIKKERDYKKGKREL